jgi:hypothetical protein
MERERNDFDRAAGSPPARPDPEESTMPPPTHASATLLTTKLLIAMTLVLTGAAGCHTALPPDYDHDPVLAAHAVAPGEPSIPIVLAVAPFAVDRRTISGGSLQRSVVEEPTALPVYYPRFASQAIPRDVAFALLSLYLFPAVVNEIDPMNEEAIPPFVRLHLSVDRYEIAFAHRNGWFWFPGLPLSLALVLPGTAIGDETFVGYLEVEASLTAGDDPHRVILHKRYHLLREVDLDECDRRLLPFTTLSAPDGFEAENYEAASEQIFPFLVRDFTRDIVADLARDDVAAAIVAGKP